MKCEQVISKVYYLEKVDHIPWSIKIHLWSCPSCAKKVQKLQRLFSELQRDAPFKVHEDMAPVVMRIIRNKSNVSQRKLSPWFWILAGVFIISGSFSVSFSHYLQWLNANLDGSLEIPLNIVLGLVISSYIIVFIGSHIDEIKNWTHFLRK